MKTEKVEKLAANLHDKEERVVNIKKLKQALDHGLRLKKVHRVIIIYLEEWLKAYIDTIKDLR